LPKTKETKETSKDKDLDIKSLLSEILLEVKNLKKQSKEFRTETKKEISDLKEEIKTRDEKWETKLNSLDSKISNVEKKTEKNIRNLVDKIKYLVIADERRARREKRNNVIIKSNGMGTETQESLNTKVKEVLRKTEVNTDFGRATYIGKDRNNRDIVSFELKTFEEKINVMKNKSKLQGLECFIDDDMTPNETEIQAELRKLAREEKEKGNSVKVGYQKLQVNGNWVNWKDLETPKGS
jgi:protein-tyrosine-phosphatase